MQAYGAFGYAAMVFLSLAILYIVAKLVFHAYFAARTQFINHMISKAKELSTNGKK